MAASHVLAQLDRRGGDDRVQVVGSRNRDRIDVLRLLVQHLPEVGVLGDLLVRLEALRGARGIRVAERHYVLSHPREGTDADSGLATRANGSDVQFFVR